MPGRFPLAILQKRMSAARQAVHCFMTGTDGTAGAALVEFAVLASLMLPFIIIPLMNVGLYIFRTIEVQHAAQAGAQYVIESMAAGNGYSSSTASAAITNATSWTPISASPPPVQFCGCPSSTGVQQTACTTSACSGTPGTYVTVSAQATYTPVVVGWFSTLPPIKASATVRIQ